MVVFVSAIAAAPTSVFPAPQGSTTTPEPPWVKMSTACRWYGRRVQPSSASSIGCGVPGVYPARSSAGHPIFSSSCLMCPRAHASMRNVSGLGRPISSGWMRLFLDTSARTAASVERSTSRPSSSRSMTRRPYRPTVSRMSIDTDGGTGKRVQRSSVASMSSESCPAARAFHSPSRVIR